MKAETAKITLTKRLAECVKHGEKIRIAKKHLATLMPLRPEVFSHEYSDDPEEVIGAINKIFLETDLLLDFFERTRRFVQDRFNIEG